MALQWRVGWDGARAEPGGEGGARGAAACHCVSACCRGSWGLHSAVSQAPLPLAVQEVTAMLVKCIYIKIPSPLSDLVLILDQ